ncbi:MAG: hypothetical protein K8W52_37090 [Deltaproteobacteria bacterium]|nr:hypothetical protein [Deltaproteobacteria bacterium]
MTAAELESALLRYFVADELDAAARARLVAAGLELIGDRARVLGQVGLFAPDDPIGHGLAWWEERQRGEPALVLPITALDQALMLYTSEPRLDPRPRPRAHCPPELRGRWQRIGVSRDDVTVAPPDHPRAWTLGNGGELATEGDPARAGWGWRVHEGSARSLCLGPAGDPLRERWTVLAFDDGEMDLVSPDAYRGFERWRRA